MEKVERHTPIHEIWALACSGRAAVNVAVANMVKRERRRIFPSLGAIRCAEIQFEFFDLS
jgi:hypothetical protein